MDQLSTPDKRKQLFSFRALSLQQKLPLLICLLLVSTVLALVCLSELAVKKAAMAMGKERLETVTSQLSAMFAQSAVSIVNTTRAAAARESFQTFMSAPFPQADDAIVRQLEKTRVDTTWVLSVLLDTNRVVIASSGVPEKMKFLDSKKSVQDIVLGPDSAAVGNFFGVNGQVFFPAIVPVVANKTIKGYLVCWRQQNATPAALAQFSQLLGTNASLYAGNQDGSLWTNLREPVAAPFPFASAPHHGFYEYSRANDMVIASANAIPHTPWTVLIEFSQGVMMESAHRFLPWIIAAGAMLVVIGIIIAWLTSRTITAPINRLQRTASLMAAGEHTEPVEEDPSPELGALARAFNAMKKRVETAQTILEKKVDERTLQLHEANKELEAFSYSVSHDLRTPLRAVSSFAHILKQEYANVLDDEGKRITDNVISGAAKMSQLIDDLIKFSRVSTIPLQQQPVNMNELVQSCLQDLLRETIQGKYKIDVQPMPSCIGDPALLRQVWINLIGNAIKYSSKKTAPQIEIGWQNGQTHGAYFVRDNGAGFDMQYADKLFGVFQRLHHETEFEGVGIGLSLVKRIVQRHHGTVCAEAAVDKGAAFYFTIPGGKPGTTGGG